MKKIIFILIIVLIGMVGAQTTITDELVNTTGNITGSYFVGDGSLLSGITEDNSSWNESRANTLYYGITNPFGFYNSTNFSIINYFTKTNILDFGYYNSTFLQNLSQLTNDLGLVSYILKWTTGNFIGSLYTTGADPNLSNSNSIFQILGSDGTPRFQVQNGGDYQASFITRSFMVVNQNNTRLNQSQNNLCYEWGFEHIDCMTSTSGADMGVQDDFEAQGLVYTGSGIYGDTSKWGVYLFLTNLTDYTAGGNNGTFTDSTDIFCDNVLTPFTSDQVANGTWIRIISGEYEGAVAKINAYISPNCVSVKNNPSWTSDLTNQVFILVAMPVFIITDGGFGEFYVGDDPQSKFEIKIENGTGVVGMYIDDVAGADQHKSLIIDTDANGHTGILGINNFFRSSIAGDGLDLVGYYGEFSPTNINNSDFSFMEFHQLGPKGTNNVRVFDIFGDYTEIMRHEEVEDIDYVGYWNGSTLTNITANATSDATDMEIFSNDNDEIYICDSVNLSEVAINLDTGASRDLSLLYYYYASDGTWKSLSVTDTTNGFRITGSIRWATPSDINLTTTDNHSNIIGESYYCVMLKRTRNNVVIAPIEDFFYATGSVQFLLRDDLIKLTPVPEPPLICDSLNDGAIYYDSDVQFHCSCKDGTGWVRMSDPTNNTGCS